MLKLVTNFGQHFSWASPKPDGFSTIVIAGTCKNPVISSETEEASFGVINKQR